jgi:AraC-like DNA-binding protein
MSTQPVDRLSSLLERFRVRTRLAHSGVMCGVQKIDQSSGMGFLHVLRAGKVKFKHPNAKDLPKQIELSAPSLIFYPQATTHVIINPPADGASFTCAAVEFDGGHPVQQALPRLVVLPLNEVDGLHESLDLLFAETERIRCGQRVLADRLFEVVLIQLLRWLLDHPARANVNTGLLVGLSSPQLTRALVAVHDAPAEAWSLERLAEVAGMSRTAFAVKFKEHLGTTPADYVADWRLSLAKVKLREGASLKMLAGELGYASQSALSRVFTARVGQSPTQWLRNQT